MLHTDFNKQFEGKIAVVTGGTQGVGEATARQFAMRGAAGMIMAQAYQEICFLMTMMH